MTTGPARRRSRRLLLRVGGVLAALLIVVVVFALTQGGSGTSLNPIAQAAALTEESSGARVSFHGTVQKGSPPNPVPFSGEGVFDGQTNRSQMTFTFSTPNGELEMEGIGGGSKMYFKSKLLQSGLPDGDEWLGFDASLGDSSETGVGANSDPSAQLDLLRAVSDKFETLGQKRIRGVETTGYRSTFDPNHYADYLREKGSVNAARDYERVAETAPSTAEVETWIDGKKLVRRIEMKVNVKDPSSGEETSTTIIEDFYDFGISPEIQLPDPSSVYDVTSKIRAQLGLEGSS